MINLLLPSDPHVDLLLFVRGPLDGQRHFVPEKVRHLECAMPFDNQLAVYRPKKDGKKLVMEFVEIIKK